jgi:hypothetical protein
MDFGWADDEITRFGDWAEEFGAELAADRAARAEAAEVAKQVFMSRQVCADCPLQRLLDCASSEVVGSRWGTQGTYVTIGDDKGRQAEVWLDEYEVLDSDTVRAILDEVNGHVEACTGPGKTPILRRARCAAGLYYRSVPPSEVRYHRQVGEAVARDGAAMTYGPNPSNRRFKNT